MSLLATQGACPRRRAAAGLAAIHSTAVAVLLVAGCAGPGAPPTAGRALPAAAPPLAAMAGGRPLMLPAPVRVDPLAGGGFELAPGLAALRQELARAMKELGAQGNPAPYFIGYELYDRKEVTISANYGALVQSHSRRARSLDVDVRVGDYSLDSTHTIRGDELDFSFSFGSQATPAPLDDDPAALRAVAWLETDRRYKAAAERLIKIRSQKTVKVADDDPSDDFSRERPVTHLGATASITVDVPTWEQRVRLLSARFRNQPEIIDSIVSLQVQTLNRWLVNSEGSLIQTGHSYVRIVVQGETHADDGMELERYEAFDASGFEGLPDEATLLRAADAIIADLRALKRAPLADPYIGPAILEGRAAGVFFHEIFGHRVEGHRQKSEDEGQTFSKKVGEAVMPRFISVYDDPTIARIGGTDLNGFYRFDDEAVAAQRAPLVEAGILRGFLLGRSPTRGFVRSNGHGRRQEGRSVVSRQGNLVVEPSQAVSVAELRQLLRAEARRQGKAYGLLFRDISGGFTNTARYGPQAFKVLPILVYRVWVDGRPDELVRGADLVGTPLASLGRILAAADDYQTLNGFCGAESGFVPVSATSPSLLLEQIEIERKDKGQNRPPLLPAPTLRAATPRGAPR